MLIKNYKTFNWLENAATMYQLGFQDPATICLCYNRNNSNDEDQDKISSSLLDLLNNSLIKNTSLEYKIFLEIVTLLEKVIKKEPLKENDIEKYFNACLIVMSETDSIYSLHNAYGLLDLTIEVVNRMEKDSKKN